jgi:alpha-mannosidase
MQPYEFERIRKIFYKLKQYRVRYQQPIDPLFLKQEDWVPYEQGSYFGEKNTYYQLKGSFQVPNDWVGNPCVLQVYSSLSEWDNTTNPQIKIYLDDTYVQAIDVNHREVTLAEGYQQKAVKLKIDLFSGRSDKPFPLHINLLALDPVVNELWFDFYTLFDSWRAIRAFGGDEAFINKFLVKSPMSWIFVRPTQRHSMKVSQKPSNCLRHVTYQRIHQNKK